MMEPSNTMILPALGAWKPAKNAGFHIPTATATAAVKLGQTVNPAPIVHFYRFLCRTEKPSTEAYRTERTYKILEGICK